jgi:DNA-binding beta-propeller fold protein YncE
MLSALLLGAPVSGSRTSLVAIGVEADARLVNGDAVVPERVSPDQVVFFDFSSGKPRRLGAVDVPVSFQGPPESIVITPDHRWAFVPAANGRSASAPPTLVPIDVLSIIDLAGATPRLAQTLHLGMAATSAALSPDGGTLVVTHADDDRATILRVSDGHAEVVGRMTFDKGSRPLAAVFLPDGRSLAITFAGSNRIGLFAWHGTTITPRPYLEISAGVYPASFAVCGNSGYAVVGNYGKVSGDADTVSLIDLRATPARVIDTVSVGPSPEGVDCSADGRHVVTANQNMSTVAPDDPRYSPRSEMVLLAIRDRKLVVTDRAAIGAWAQGAAFVGDDIVAGESIEDGRLHLFRLTGDKFVRLDPVRFEHGGPAVFGRAPDR